MALASAVERFGYFNSRAITFSKWGSEGLNDLRGALADFNLRVAAEAVGFDQAFADESRIEKRLDAENKDRERTENDARRRLRRPSLGPLPASAAWYRRTGRRKADGRRDRFSRDA